MNSLRHLALCFSLGASLVISGCASNLSGEVYSRDDARSVQQVKFGTIEAVRPVVIEGDKSIAGGGAGAAIGAVAGNSVGGGSGRSAATVIGALAGAAAGALLEERATRAQGVELTIRMDSGKVIAIVQEASENDNFNVGDRVRLASLNGNTRAIRN